MKVVITGGSGFVGGLLARRVLEEGIAVDGAPTVPVDSLTLVDLVAPAADLAADRRVTPIVADLGTHLDGGLGGGLGGVDAADVVFHLAGMVSAAAEADLAGGYRTNVDGLRGLLARCASRAEPPVVVFSSSLAVFGDDPGLPGALGIVDDTTMPRPQSSYGAQKLIGEVLVADYTRRGLVRGRTTRLMTVAVRPGRPNAAASSFVSGIIREPLAGARSTLPVDLDLPIALSSPRRTIDGLLAAAAVDGVRWGSATAMNLPSLTTTPRAMLAALDQVSGRSLSRLVDLVPDPGIAAIVGSWPARFVTARAAALGLEPEGDFAAIVQAYVQGLR